MGEGKGWEVLWLKHYEKRKRQSGLRKDPLNRLRHLRKDLFTYTAAMHIELIGFTEYYGMPRGHKDDPIYSHLIQYLRAPFGPIFL